MEKYRVAASFTQRTTTFQTTPSFISLPPKTHLKEPPISSYLRTGIPFSSSPATAGLERRIGRCVDDTEISIFDAERYFNEGHDAIKRTIILNGAAERCGRAAAHRRDSSFSSVDGYARHVRTCSFYSTPTTSSEASWNSQSGLLCNLPGSVAVAASALPLKDPTKSPSAAGRLFGRKCPCSGRKSVDVEEKCSEPKSPISSSLDLNTSLAAKNLSFRTEEVSLSCIPERATPEEIENEFGVEEMIKVKITPGIRAQNPNFFGTSTRFSTERSFPADIGPRMVNSGSIFGDTDGFSFPILNLAEETPRKSLEVFRQTTDNTPAELQRRAVVFPFSDEGDRRSFTFPEIPKPPPDDDVASDASSDLFEIESFTTQMTYRRRESLDSRDHLRRGLAEEAPPLSIAPRECYSPSEVSVEWSVTTAEGFDRTSLANFSSAASDHGDLRFVHAERERFAAGMSGAAAGGRRRCSGLLGCRNEKAVSVGPKPVRLSTPVGFEPVRKTKSRTVRTR